MIDPLPWAPGSEGTRRSGGSARRQGSVFLFVPYPMPGFRGPQRTPFAQVRSMIHELPLRISIGAMLRPLPPKEQVVRIDRLLKDPKLPGKARLPLEELRSALMVDLIDAARREK